MKIATAYSIESAAEKAVSESYQQLQQRLGATPDLLMVYYASPYESGVVSHTLSRLAGSECQIHGSTSCLGSMTEEGFHSAGGVGLSLWGMVDPEGDYGTGLAEIGDNPEGAAAEALAQALEQSGRIGEVPTLVWINGAPGQEEALITGVESVLGPNVPIAGGSSGDNTVAGEWAQIANGVDTQSAVVISVLFPSTEISYAFHSGYDPTEITGVVTRCEERVLMEIDGRPAAEVYNEWTEGSVVEQLEEGGNVLALTTLFPLGRVAGEVGGLPYYKLSHPDSVTADGGLTLFSNIEEGDSLTLMRGTIESLVSRAGRVTDAAVEAGDFTAEQVVGGLAIYCAGCMLTVQPKMNEVSGNIHEALSDAPFVGVFTFGEQGCFLANDNAHGNLMISVVAFSNQPIQG
ncbi:MAG: hypothetical protein HON68_00600 [Gammaproteobacteria bacterium]|nr:hypothetical protein [Gammaproteobacteria bacterium]MBT3489498.1 hypothetical protein [Gammaproteobacteria bacterium]MBT3719756.1 hypothetical protein [Gammaproteobacteria bacterium]MBT3844257.1 hypothetical protein [Gammaproteobacteria bacterium]MBT3894059.1 hypothetical protein [Gammaproteobacteria bacterium]